MSEQRISGAIDRIECALARIEAQSAYARDDAPATARYEALRSRVAANLSRLDELIESLEQ